MTYIQAFIIAVIEGLTEFLPVSSTGHMMITTAMLGLEITPFVKLFTIAIQLGAILIVKVNNRYYIKGLHHKFSYDEVKERIEENLKNKKFKTRKCYLIRYR